MSHPEGPSHSEHMVEMARLYLRRLGPGRLRRQAIYAAYCAGYVEGIATERIKLGGGRRMSRREHWQRAGD